MRNIQSCCMLIWCVFHAEKVERYSSHIVSRKAPASKACAAQDLKPRPKSGFTFQDLQTR